MNDRIRELAFFLRVSEETSFSAAARSLDLDPSTISKVIQRLENRLGVRLFHRTSRVLQLTQEGERFLSAAQKVIAALEQAEASLRPAANAEASGVLRVSSTPAFARHHLAPLMPDFIAQHPQLRVQFVLAVTRPTCSSSRSTSVSRAATSPIRPWWPGASRSRNGISVPPPRTRSAPARRKTRPSCSATNA